MQWLRNLLIGGILVITFFLFIEWNEFSAKQKEALRETAKTSESLSPSVNGQVDTGPYDTNAIPSAPQNTFTKNNEAEDIPTILGNEPVVDKNTTSSSQIITVKTDTLEIDIDTLGGDIVQSSLLKHHAKLDEPENHFILLNRSNAHTYVAQSGLIGPNGTDKGNQSRPIFTAKQKTYSLEDNSETLVVDLTLDQSGVLITKRFRFTRDTYLIDMEYIIDNKTIAPWSAAIYGQIRRDSYTPDSDTGIGMKPYVGAAITTPEKNYKKLDFGDLEEEQFKVEQTGGWVAMVQHYFLSAWVPDQEVKNSFKLRKLSNKDLYLLEYTGGLVTVDPNSQGVIKTSFYTGPKNIKKLEKISPYLDLTIDYSFLWFIAKPLFATLDFIHGVVGNWGVAIILLTIMIKIMFFYPSALSYRSMAKMRKLAPMMAELKERYGEDKQKMSGELMKLYKKEKVNPLGGCLPILLQMPVFISLYWVIMESVELRHSPFYFWIQDLSIKDPFFVLPLIMGITMFIQQKLNPVPPDPMQAKVMQMMPIFFTFLFMFFPAGLVLYWVVNNTLSITQQYVITKQIENAK